MLGSGSILCQKNHIAKPEATTVPVYGFVFETKKAPLCSPSIAQPCLDLYPRDPGVECLRAVVVVSGLLKLIRKVGDGCVVRLLAKRERRRVVHLASIGSKIIQYIQ